MSRMVILHLIDQLEIGGAERVAVNLSNGLSRDGDQIFLCASRRAGPLARALNSQVRYFCLKRRGRFDPIAFIRLVRFVLQNQIQIIHAHSTSLFLAVMVQRLVRGIKIIWHDHYGDHAFERRSSNLYRWFVLRASAVISVNRQLASWTINSLGVPEGRVCYIPNFIQLEDVQPVHDLPGDPGYRIVCVAGLRPQKDHSTLIRAMEIVCKEELKAHLLLVGREGTKMYMKGLWEEIGRLGLEDKITWLGPRNDVQAVLRACDIGVLSSRSEGLPLSLLEYGAVGLPAVASSVGECSEVLDNGKVGLLVPSGNPDALSDAILDLLRDRRMRELLGQGFHARVLKEYSASAALATIRGLYNRVLETNGQF